MEKKPSIVVTILLFALTAFVLVVASLMAIANDISPGHPVETLLVAMALLVLVVAVGTVRSLWHRRWLESSAVTTVLCGILLILVGRGLF